ncbi:MAG: hypothetical protein ACOY5B_17345 [Spirochaetota bacterium]
MLNYLRTLVFILFMLSLGFTWRYQYWLLYHLSFGALFVLALFIAFTFVVGFYLKDSTNTFLKALGEVYEKLFQYTALAQGVFYTTLVFYVVGTTVNREIPLPDFDRQFMFDWMYGSGYATLLVYVSLLAMLLFFQKLSPQGYLLAAFIATFGVALPIYMFAAEPRVKNLHAQHGGFFTYTFILTHLTLSAAGMYSMVLIGKKNQQKRKK